jgi:hypothetical protein
MMGRFFSESETDCQIIVSSFLTSQEI